MPTLYKMFWIYLLTNCDSAGVWEVDWEDANRICGGEIDPEKAGRFFLGRNEADPLSRPKAISMRGGFQWFLVSYIEYQYSGGLNNNSPWAKSVKKQLEKHNIDWQTLTPQHADFNPYLTLSKGLTEHELTLRDRIGIGQDREEDKERDRTGRGGAGGDEISACAESEIVRHQPAEDSRMFAALVAAFISAYGDYGRQVKRGSIEQALRDALRNCIANGYPNMVEAGKFLCEQAGRACAADIAKKVDKRLNPETWLDERAYETPIDTSPPKRGPTDEEEIQRKIKMMEEYEKNGR